MQFRIRPLFGAIALSVFITLCTAWIAIQLGMKVPMVIYGSVFCVLAFAIYGYALKLAPDNDARQMTQPRHVDALRDLL